MTAVLSCISSTPPPPSCAETLRAVQELMQANQAQHEALRMVTAAVSEGAKGKDMLLTDLSRNPLIAVHLLGSETQHNALLEENARLRAEMEDVRRKGRRDSEKARCPPLWPATEPHVQRSLCSQCQPCIVSERQDCETCVLFLPVAPRFKCLYIFIYYVDCLRYNLYTYINHLLPSNWPRFEMSVMLAA